MLNTDIRRTGRTGSLDRLDMFLLHSSERKKLTGARLSSEAEGSSQIGRGQHLAHSSGKALRIFRREQHAGLAKHLRNRASIRRDDGGSTGHGLQNATTKGLDLARMHETARSAVRATEHFRSHHSHKAALDSQRCRLFLELAPERPITTHDQKRWVRDNPADCIEEKWIALVSSE